MCPTVPNTSRRPSNICCGNSQNTDMAAIPFDESCDVAKALLRCSISLATIMHRIEKKYPIPILCRAGSPSSCLVIFLMAGCRTRLYNGRLIITVIIDMQAFQNSVQSAGPFLGLVILQMFLLALMQSRKCHQKPILGEFLQHILPPQRVGCYTATMDLRKIHHRLLHCPPLKQLSSRI